MKSKLIVLTIVLLLLISACELTPTPVPTKEEPAPQPTKTFTPEPDPTQTEVVSEAAEDPVPEPTAAFTATPIPCVELLEPLDGIDLPGNARVTFSWSAHPEAKTYSLNFVFPDGLELFFAIDETSTARYMSGFSMHPAYNQSGEHQWNVSALNAAGEELCQSDFFIFTKDLSDGVGEESSNNGGDGDNNSGCTGFDCGSGFED